MIDKSNNLYNGSKFDWRHDISWLNVWFSIGIILSLFMLGDLFNVFDFGLYSDDCFNQILNGDFIKCF